MVIASPRSQRIEARKTKPSQREIRGKQITVIIGIDNDDTIKFLHNAFHQEIRK